MKLKSILQIKSLEYEVDNQKIIKGLSFNINHKKHKLILGNSGSGKTTLLNHILKMVLFQERKH